MLSSASYTKLFVVFAMASVALSCDTDEIECKHEFVADKASSSDTFKVTWPYTQSGAKSCDITASSDSCEIVECIPNPGSCANIEFQVENTGSGDATLHSSCVYNVYEAGGGTPVYTFSETPQGCLMFPGGGDCSSGNACPSGGYSSLSFQAGQVHIIETFAGGDDELEVVCGQPTQKTCKYKVEANKVNGRNFKAELLDVFASSNNVISFCNLDGSNAGHDSCEMEEVRDINTDCASNRNAVSLENLAQEVNHLQGFQYSVYDPTNGGPGWTLVLKQTCYETDDFSGSCTTSGPCQSGSTCGTNGYQQLRFESAYKATVKVTSAADFEVCCNGF